MRQLTSYFYVEKNPNIIYQQQSDSWTTDMVNICKFGTNVRHNKSEDELNCQAQILHWRITGSKISKKNSKSKKKRDYICVTLLCNIKQLLIQVIHCQTRPYANIIVLKKTTRKYLKRTQILTRNSFWILYMESFHRSNQIKRFIIVWSLSKK